MHLFPLWAFVACYRVTFTFSGQWITYTHSRPSQCLCKYDGNCWYPKQRSGKLRIFLKHFTGFSARRTVHTHTHTHTAPLVQNYAAKHRPSTRQTSVHHYEFQSSTALYSLMTDRIRSETCWSDF